MPLLQSLRQSVRLPAPALPFTSIALLALIATPAGTLPAQPPSSPGSQSQPSGGFTPPPIRVFTREIALDIDVTDADGHPVHNLTQSDFTVFENGRPQPVRSFRERSTADSAPPSPAQSPALAPNTFSNEAQPEGPLPLTILLVDWLDTPMANQIILEKQLNDVVARSPKGARVAVFFISDFGQLSMLQGFTSDPEQLRRAVKSIKTQIPPLEDAGQDNNNTDAAANPVSAADARASATTAISTNPQTSLLEPAVNGGIECTKALSRVAYTYTALGEIARFVHGMPGRKNLIWFTGLFPMGMGDGKGNLCYNSQEDLTSSDDLLENAHVVVYMVDPRAMDVLARYGAQSRLGRLQANEHLNMEYIAEQTGGRAFYNTNDLSGAALQALDSGFDYYALTYSPTDQHWDTRKRTINVKVDRPGLKLVYKTSYNAYPPHMNVTPGGRPIEKATPVQAAMMRGAPQPTEILFRVNVASAGASPTPAPGNAPDPKMMKAPYRALALTYTVDISNMQFDQQPDGTWHGQFEYAVNVYSHDGKLINSSTLAAKPALPAEVYESMRNSGLKLRQTVDVPASGDAVLRIGIHDTASDHLGAIEIPTSSLTP